MRVAAAAAAAKPTDQTNSRALVNAIVSDPQALAALAAALAQSGLVDEIHTSITATVAAHARGEAGRLLAGVVSNLTGWLIPAGGGVPAKAMVFLNGSSVATACVVASYVLPDLTAGAQVWVEAVNGVRADLLIVGLRAFTATPAASLAATAVQRAGDTMTGALTGPAYHGPADTLAATAGGNLPGGKLGKAAIGDILDASNGVDTYLKAASGHLYFQSGGVTQVTIDNAGNLSLGGIGGLFPSGQGTAPIKGARAFSGNGPGTYSHGMSVQPYGVGIIANNGSSTTTFGSSSYTTSSVTIAMATSMQFTAIALG